ncbi:MAG: hypothetical protein ABW007_19390 [Chitinophagaceae bacterium]
MINNPDEIKNHALIAGGIGAFVRLAIVKPKSVWVGLANASVGAVFAWFFSPIIVHYTLGSGSPGEDASITKFRESAGGAIAFIIGFSAIWCLTWLATLFNETKGNPIAAWSIIKQQINNATRPQQPLETPTINPTPKQDEPNS